MIGHTVRGSLALLQDGLTATEPEQNVLADVSDFKRRSCEAGELARKRLSVS